MSEPLEEREVAELAELLFDERAARRLLRAAGMRRADQPAWARSGIFWGEVSDLLADGMMDDGRRRVVAQASVLFPGNEVFKWATAPSTRVSTAGPTTTQDPRRRERAEPSPRRILDELNAPAIAALREYLNEGSATAILGSASSSPLYPRLPTIVEGLLHLTAGRIEPTDLATARTQAAEQPKVSIEIVRRAVGDAEYRDALNQILGSRRDETSGKTWTESQEAIVRCNFRGIITTNHDLGISDARLAVRSWAATSGYCSWANEEILEGWRGGGVFTSEELPILYAHGSHGRPHDIVLTNGDYGRAYAGKLSKVLAELIESDQMVWIGFDSGYHSVASLLARISAGSGGETRSRLPAHHVAIVPINLEPDNTPDDLARLHRIAEEEHGCPVALYRRKTDGEASLVQLLAELVDSHYPPVIQARRYAGAAGRVRPVVMRPRPGHAGVSIRWPGASLSSASNLRRRRPLPEGTPTTEVDTWVHGGDQIDGFIARVDELDRLDRWALEPEVRLIGVTAWGGAGKTALVTEWLAAEDRLRGRPDILGVFAWSFYENRSVEGWSAELIRWFYAKFGLKRKKGISPALEILKMASEAPVVLVLDGLEVLQEGPDGSRFGRLLDGTLLTVLEGWCQSEVGGLAVLTSRFPFADLEPFVGTSARILDVPPFTPEEGAHLLARGGSRRWPEHELRALSRAVDGHPLALGALATLMLNHPAIADMTRLRLELERLGTTKNRVSHVLQYYSSCLSEADRRLVGLVSLFQRPMPADAILTLGQHQKSGSPLDGWTAEDIVLAARGRLSGLLACNSENVVSAHPLVRQSFRPLALTADAAQLATDIVLADIPPSGPVTTRDDALKVVEMLELLVDADMWDAARDLYQSRTDNGRIWHGLPASALGQRCAAAFVATSERSSKCLSNLGGKITGHFLNGVGIHSYLLGDATSARSFLELAIAQFEKTNDHINVATARTNLSTVARLMGDGAAALTETKNAIKAAMRIWDVPVQTRRLKFAHYQCAAAMAAVGRVHDADEKFLYASSGGHRNPTDDEYGEIEWAWMLLTTGRVAAGLALASERRSVATRAGWGVQVAQCDWLLGIAARLNGDYAAAGAHLRSASSVFLDGDSHMYRARSLLDLARLARDEVRPQEAELICGQVINFAGQRGFVPLQAAALALRAQARGDMARLDSNWQVFNRARDDADHALRLATRTKHLPWEELAALDAHVLLDEIRDSGKSWRRLARGLRARLLPEDLPEDPRLTSLDSQNPSPSEGRHDPQGF